MRLEQEQTHQNCQYFIILVSARIWQLDLQKLDFRPSNLKVNFHCRCTDCYVSFLYYQLTVRRCLERFLIVSFLDVSIIEPYKKLYFKKFQF